MEDANLWRPIHNDYTKMLEELPAEWAHIEIVNRHTGINQFGYFTFDGGRFFIRVGTMDSKPTLLGNNYQWRYFPTE